VAISPIPQKTYHHLDQQPLLHRGSHHPFNQEQNHQELLRSPQYSRN
jgi:hypothetical protein